MESSDRRLDSAFGSSRSNLIALTTLIAAIGFTPWARGTGVPWAQFIFRSLGLAALLLISLGYSKGSFASSARQIRVTRCMVLFALVSAVSAAFSIHRGKS